MLGILTFALAFVSFVATPAARSDKPAPSGSSDYAVIASPDVPIDQLTPSDVRRIFMLDRGYWKSGQPIVVLLPPTGSRTRRFLTGHVCGTDDSRLKRTYLEKMYRGEIDLAPKVVDSDQDAISFVSSSRGLVALVPATMVGSAKVRVLSIDGKRPGTSSYPFRD